MAQLDMQQSAGNGKITLTQFQQIFRNKLISYKDYITGTMLNEKMRAEYLKYTESSDPKKEFKLPKGLNFGAFAQVFLHSVQFLEDNMDWQTKVCGGSTMAVTGTPGVAKTSIIMDTCAELGIACVHYTLAGLTSADIKGLPFIVRDADGVTTGVDYEQGMKLPISPLSAKMAKMPFNVVMAKSKMGMPSEMRYLDQGSVFAYDDGLASEFGVLLLDEFTGTDDRGKAALQKIISQSERGYRGLAEGSYVFPPYWLVVCAMNSSSEGGMSNGEDDQDMCEFIRQRVSAGGFYTVYADAGTREYMHRNPEFGEVIPTFLDWADAQGFKRDVVTSMIPGEDKGFVQYPGENGKMSSPRLWMQAARQADAMLLVKRREEWEKTADPERKAALEKEIALLEESCKDETLNGKKIDKKARTNLIFGVDENGESDGEEPEFDYSEDRLDPYMQRVDLTQSIIASRAAEMRKINKELTCAEWQAILDAVFGIPEITAKFAEFYNVHAGVYHYFHDIEDKFLPYLKGEKKESPKLASLESVAKDMIALTMCCKGYILSISQRAFFECFETFKAKLEEPIKTEADLNELAERMVAMYTIPLRAIRWLNDSDKFPVAVKDTIIALSKNLLDMTLQGVPITGSAQQAGGFNASVTYYLAKPLLAKSADIKVASKLSPLAKGAAELLLVVRGKTAFLYHSKEHNWKPVPLKKPITLPSGQAWPYEMEDKKDLDFLDLFLSKSSAEGNNVRDLYAQSAKGEDADGGN